MREEYRKLLGSQMKVTTRKIVEEYLQSPNADGEITCYMDAFYQQMLKDNANNNKDSTFDGRGVRSSLFHIDFCMHFS